MTNVINRDLLKDFFTTFSTIQVIWFKGNLNTFSDTELIIDDISVIGDVIDFFGIKYEAFDVTCGLVIYDDDFFKQYGFSHSADMGYIECKRGDYI